MLLVEDDLVSRKLCSKFLQISGCEIGIAVDGLGAINKMELEEYDLVLMVTLSFSPENIYLKTCMLMDYLRILSSLNWMESAQRR